MAFRIKNKTLGISYSAAEAVRLREQAGIDAVVALVSAKGSIVMSAGRPAVVRGPNPQMVDGEDLVVPVTQMIPGLASVLGAALREAPGRRRSIRHAKGLDIIKCPALTDIDIPVVVGRALLAGPAACLQH